MPEIPLHYVPVLSGQWGHRTHFGKLNRRSVAAMRSWATEHPELSLQAKASQLAAAFQLNVMTIREVLTGQSWVR